MQCIGCLHANTGTSHHSGQGRPPAYLTTRRATSHTRPLLTYGNHNHVPHAASQHRKETRAHCRHRRTPPRPLPEPPLPVPSTAEPCPEAARICRGANLAPSPAAAAAAPADLAAAGSTPHSTDRCTCWLRGSRAQSRTPAPPPCLLRRALRHQRLDCTFARPTRSPVRGPAAAPPACPRPRTSRTLPRPTAAATAVQIHPGPAPTPAVQEKQPRRRHRTPAAYPRAARSRRRPPWGAGAEGVRPRRRYAAHGRSELGTAHPPRRRRLSQASGGSSPRGYAAAIAAGQPRLRRSGVAPVRPPPCGLAAESRATAVRVTRV
jgi:hypothetical protein